MRRWPRGRPTLRGRQREVDVFGSGVGSRGMGVGSHEGCGGRYLGVEVARWSCTLPRNLRAVWVEEGRDNYRGGW